MRLENYKAKVLQCIEEIDEKQLDAIVDTIHETYVNKRTVYIIGNGGSAATASHLALHLRKGFGSQTDNKGMPAHSLAENAPLITALGNDIGYDEIFHAQLQPILIKGDLIIIISGSGNSANLTKVIDLARSRQAAIIGLLGFGGGKLKTLCDSSIIFSVSDYGPVEDAHLSLSHIIPRLLRERIKDE